MLHPIGRSYFFGFLIALSTVFVCSGFGGICVADEAPHYENYFGDEITSAACDQNCIEEWKLRRTYICELAMNDLHYELVPDSCAI